MFEAGLPVPEVGELIEIDYRLGQVYERIDEKSSADELFSIINTVSEIVIKLANELAEAHARFSYLKIFS